MADLGDFDEYDPGEDSAGAGDSAPADATAADPEAAAANAAADGPSGSGSSGDAADADRFDPLSVDAAAEERGIGTLAASEGLAISERADDTRLRAYVTADNRSTVRLGRYLLVDYPPEPGSGREERLFCRIEALEYAREFHADDATEIHARRAMGSDGIDERDYKLLASLDPLAILYPDDGELKRRQPDRVPKPDTVVQEATESASIKTGLKIPEEGVFLGHLSVGGERVRTAAEPPTIDYRLKDDYDAGDPLVFRHTLIAGGTGSGKTHAAKNVLRQFLAEERTYAMDDGREVSPAVVIFDPQDEYAQLHDDNPAVTDSDRRRWDRQGIAHGGHADTTVFAPSVGAGGYSADHHRAEQVAFSIPFSMVEGRPWLVAGASLNDNQYGALTHLLGRFFERAGEAATYGGFADFLDDPGLREELDESGRVHEATYDAVRRRVLSVPGQVFDGDAPAITDLVHEFVRPGGASVVPTYHLNDSRATELVVLALSSLLIDEKLSNAPTHDRIAETPLIVGMDEAHNFLADAENVQARKVISKFTEAAKQGRKERLGLFLITQDPQDVADAIFKQINTTAVLNLGDDDAISAVNIPTTLESKVPYMETGQFVVYAPDNSEPVEVTGLPKCVTRHGR